MNRFVGLFFTILVSIALSEAGHPGQAEIMAAAEKCQGKTKATPADMEALRKYSPDMSKEAKCVIACVMQDYLLLSPDGKLKKDAFMKQAEDLTKGDAGMMAIATEIFETCQSRGDPDICVAAFNYEMCMQEQMKAKNISMDM